MKKILAKCNENAYLPILHLSRVEQRCKLQEILQHATVPKVFSSALLNVISLTLLTAQSV